MLSRFNMGVIMVFFLFAMASVAEAQMINYKRRNQRQSVKKTVSDNPQRVSSDRKAEQKLNYYRGDYAAESVDREELSAQPRVTNRVERLYDLNRDGYLQQDEVADFYRDVVSSVQNRGSFRVSSELLRDFDADQDGRISRYEVSEISNRLN